MAKKKHHEEHHEEHADETWLIPYADLLTLLLALFIVLFAFSKIDQQKVDQMRDAFAEAFGTSNTMERATLNNFADEVNDTLGPIGDARGSDIDIANVDLFEEGSSAIKREALPTLRKIAELLESSRYKRFRVRVEGHTADVDTGSEYFASAWEMSAARAAAVVNAFVKMGMAPGRFQAIGMAATAPAYPDYDAYGQPIPENHKRNRRVSIRVEV